VSLVAADRKPFVVAFAAAAAVVAADQVTKTWAVRSLRDGPVEVIGEFAEFRLSFNSGAAFSLFTGQTPFLAVLAIGITVALVWILARTHSTGMGVGLGLLLGGALGNLGDRVFRAPSFLHGQVVDFISVGTFPTFNVADSAITIGAVVIIWYGLRGGLEPDPTP
jgi:signal peptidase II